MSKTGYYIDTLRLWPNPQTHEAMIERLGYGTLAIDLDDATRLAEMLLRLANAEQYRPRVQSTDEEKGGQHGQEL